MQLIGCVRLCGVGNRQWLTFCLVALAQVLHKKSYLWLPACFLVLIYQGPLGMLANACKWLRLEVSNDTTDLIALSKSHVLEP